MAPLLADEQFRKTESAILIVVIATLFVLFIAWIEPLPAPESDRS